MNKYPLLLPGKFYHIFNRGNNSENLFYTHNNYLYFLKKYDHYLYNYLDLYAYCLLPNHFHLLVKVKKKKDFKVSQNPKVKDDISSIVSQQFSNLFNGYAKAINKQQARSGSLFQKNFKRIIINNHKYLTNLIYYIHTNPQNHGLIDNFSNWPYNSYAKYLITKESKLPKAEVLNWFGSAEEYKVYHDMIIKDKSIKNIILE